MNNYWVETTGSKLLQGWEMEIGLRLHSFQGKLDISDTAWSAFCIKRTSTLLLYRLEHCMLITRDKKLSLID
jgi:hypothetical protein